MRKRLRRRFSAAIAVVCERMEKRQLMSLTTFTLNPTLSVLTLGVKATYSGLTATETSQGKSTINNSESSLTSHFSGTMQAILGTNTLQFVAGSSVNAEVNGTWKPGLNPNPSASNDSNATMTAAADFAGVGTIPFLGTEYSALRNLVFDAQSPVLPISGSAYPTDGLLEIDVTHGNSYYDGVTGAIGSDDLTGDNDTDGSGQPITLQFNSSNSTETMAIPISVKYTEVISSATIVSTFTGSIVATASQPAPSAALKLDADKLHIDLTTSNTKSVVQQFQLGQVNSIAVSTTGGAGTFTINNSAGNVVLPGGINVIGDGSTSLVLIGSGGNDSVVQQAGVITDNGNPINLTGVSTTSLGFNAGTDAIAVLSGTLTLTSQPDPTLYFSSISIGSGSVLQAPVPTAGVQNNLLITSGLTIAGSTGAWTGALDLGENYLDVQGGNLAAISNYAASAPQSLGLFSTNALSDTTHLTTLGIILNNLNSASVYGSGTSLGLFDGYSPATTDVLVKYTYYGDANLDGKVDGSDYTRIDNGYHSQLTGWFNGDLNYDGHIDGSDYTLIDNAFNTQKAKISAVVAVVVAQKPCTTPRELVSRGPQFSASSEFLTLTITTDTIAATANSFFLQKKDVLDSLSG